MYRLKPQTVQALTGGGYRATSRVAATRGGQPLRLPLDLLDGEVQATSQPGVQRTLSVDVKATGGLWDELAPLGVQMAAFVRLGYGTGTEEVPQGVFELTSQSVGYGVGGRVLSLTGADTWVRVQRRRFDRPVQPEGDPIRFAAAYIVEAVGVPLAPGSMTSSDAEVWGQVYESDREQCVLALLDAAGAIAYVDRLGRPVIRKQPTLRGAGVFTVRAGRRGTLIEANRTRTAEAVRNRVIVTASGGARFPTQVVDDTDPASPTRVTGPFGVVPIFYSNPALRTAEQAYRTGELLLSRTTGLSAGLTVTQAPHYGLDPWDLLNTSLPPQHGDERAPERHLLDTISTPLPGPGATGGTQQLTMRSPRPEGSSDVVVTG